MAAKEIREKLSKLETAVKSESSDAHELLLDIKVCAGGKPSLIINRDGS